MAPEGSVPPGPVEQAPASERALQQLLLLRPRGPHRRRHGPEEPGRSGSGRRAAGPRRPSPADGGSLCRPGGEERPQGNLEGLGSCSGPQSRAAKPSWAAGTSCSARGWSSSGSPSSPVPPRATAWAAPRRWEVLVTGTERASKSKPSVTSPPGPAGPLKLLQGHPQGPAPIWPSPEDCGREAALHSSAARGRRAGRRREGQGHQPAVAWPSPAPPAPLSPHAPLPSVLPPKSSLCFPQMGPHVRHLFPLRHAFCFPSPAHTSDVSSSRSPSVPRPPPPATCAVSRGGRPPLPPGLGPGSGLPFEGVGRGPPPSAW